MILALQNKLEENQVASELKFNELQNQITYLTQMQEEIKNKELQAELLRNKRKNRVKLPLWSTINLSEYHGALNIIADKFENKDKQNLLNTTWYVVAWDRIAIYIFYFSGLWVANLLNFSLADIENLFMKGSDQETSVKVIKKRDKVVEHHMMVSKAILNKYVFGEFNLIEDFKLLKANDIVALNKQFDWTTPVNEDNVNLKTIPFYASFKTSFEVASRVTVTANINSILCQVTKITDSTTRILSSHSFRINMITKLITHEGLDYASNFAAHADARTTSLYDRSIFDPTKLKNISDILGNTWTGKKHLENKEWSS